MIVLLDTSSSDANPLVRHPSVTLHPATPVEHLGEAIAQLVSRLHAATYESLVMLRDLDAQYGWNDGRRGAPGRRSRGRSTGGSARRTGRHRGGRIACDAAVVARQDDAQGSLLDIGRKC